MSSSNKQQNQQEVVEFSGKNPLKIIFQTLFLQKKCLQQDLADYCGVDKGYISKIVNGHWIPDLKMRLKIASFFKDLKGKPIDSSLIWRYQDLNYIKKLLKQQKKESAISGDSAGLTT